MTQAVPLNNLNAAQTAEKQRSAAAPESQAFRDTLAQLSVEQLSVTLDTSATLSRPGAGVARADASAAPQADIAALASEELIRQDQQRGIRDRGLDASSASAQQLRSRGATPNEQPTATNVATQDPASTTAQRVTVSSLTQTADTQSSASHTVAHTQDSSKAALHTPTQQPAAHAASAPASSAGVVAPNAVGGVSRSASAGASVRTAAAVQAVNSMNTAASTTKQTAVTQPFSVERTNARSDRAIMAKPAKAPAQQPDPAAQIQRGLAQVLRQGGGSLTMKLTPHELGEVKIALRMQHNRVEGTIDAQTVSARDLLKQNLDVLRASLEQRGVTVDRLDVRLQGAAESDANARSGAEPRHEHAGAQADAGGDRSTGNAGGGDRHAGSRGGAPDAPERSDDRGADAPDRDDGHGRPDEHAGGWLRLDTTA